MTQDPGAGQPGSQPGPSGQQPGGYDPNQGYQQPGGYDPNQPYQGGYDPTQAYQQPGYGQPGYAQPGYPGYTQQYPYPPAPRGTNTMAILAIIFAFVFAPLGIVFGLIARSQIKQSGEEGAGLALAGIIIGAIFSALFLLLIIFWIVFFAAVVSTVPNISDLPTDITNVPFPTR
jgi:hypothetical protein